MLLLFLQLVIFIYHFFYLSHTCICMSWVVSARKRRIGSSSDNSSALLGCVPDCLGGWTSHHVETSDGWLDGFTYIGNMSLHTNSSVLKCCIWNISLFKGLCRMAVLWSYREKFISGRISNQHVRMRGTSLTPYTSFSPWNMPPCTTLKPETLCACKNQNLLAQQEKGKKAVWNSTTWWHLSW